MRYLLMIATLLLMVACTAIPDPIPATLTPEDAPIASSPLPATPTAEQLPTEPPASTEPPSNESTPANCEVPVYEDFIAYWQTYESDCPTRPAETGDGVFQPFALGVMIRVNASDEDPAFIYVLNTDGTWQRYEDRWREGEPERADLTPPSGFVEPERGFGLVWREQLGGANATIGWALVQEEAQQTIIQPFGGDIALQAGGARVYWLFEDGRWE